MEIKVKTTNGHDTTLTVMSKDICDGAFTIGMLTCIDSNAKVKIYDDEIDNLIVALQELKKELR